MARYTGPASKKSRRLKTDFLSVKQAESNYRRHTARAHPEKEYTPPAACVQKAGKADMYGVLGTVSATTKTASRRPGKDRREPAAHPRVASQTTSSYRARPGHTRRAAASSSHRPL